MKIAVMVDGGFLNKKIKKNPDPQKQALRIVEAAKRVVDDAEEDLYRIFYYDSAPFDGLKHDLSGTRIDFSKTPQFKYQKSLLAHLAQQPHVAVRLGVLSFDGWKLTPAAMLRLRKTKLSAGPLSMGDFKPDLKQKGVDMRIGLDIALLSLDGLVERIALITADSDFIPAMKLARREGIQVVLSSLAGHTKPELGHHADIYRNPNLTLI